MAKVAKNGRKVKAIALLFCCFLPTYEKRQKSLKMEEKLGYSLTFWSFLATFSKMQ
jgi:archaellum biogenesis protein FlaJ (TadC family)